MTPFTGSRTELAFRRLCNFISSPRTALRASVGLPGHLQLSRSSFWERTLFRVSGQICTSDIAHEDFHEEHQQFGLAASGIKTLDKACSTVRPHILCA
jgi:hypothetical protein